MNIEMLKKLMLISSVSGHEDEILDYIDDFFIGHDGCSVDRQKNYLFIGDREIINECLCFVIHVDEVGFESLSIQSDNIIKLKSIGSVPKISSWGMTVKNKEGNISGIIQPIQEKSIYEIFDDNLSIHLINLNSLENISKGMPFNFDCTSIYNDEFIIGKGLDNKVGIFLVGDLIRNNISNGGKCCIFFSTKEEISECFYPDFFFDAKTFIVVDAYSTVENDCNPLGGGVISGRGVNLDDLKKKLNKNGIKYQESILDGRTGTEMDFILNDARYSMTPFYIISYPLSFMHTAREKTYIQDISSVEEIITTIINQ